jgi:thioredoxin 1
MKRKIIIIGAAAIIVLAGAFLFYFFYLENPSRQTLAKVNDEKITAEQFNNELAKLENPFREMNKEEPNQFLESIIIKNLFLQEAKKQGISAPTKTYKDTTKESVSLEEILIRELIKKKFPSPPTVTPQEIEAFYTMYKDRMGGKPLAQVAPLIEQVIQEGKQQEMLGRFIEDLRKNAKIEIDQDRLKKMAVNPPESNTKEEFEKAMKSGMPVLVDFGANSCVPCRQMRPILKEVSKEYSDKAKVLVMDVYKYRDLAKQHTILAIPTLIFFDSKGKEVFRHMGLLDKEKIVAKFKEIGIGT